MRNLKSKNLWKRVQPLTLLTEIMFPSLKSLYISHFPSLVELPCSFKNLHQLRELEIKNCVNLENLPTDINLQSLRELDLRGCSRLRTFPDISTNILWLYLSETAIEEVPCWIEKFDRLEGLEMSSCINLETLPTGINFQFLWKLDLSGCSRLKTFPDISTNIEKLNLSETAIEEVPGWIEKFSCLRELKMKGCIYLETLPMGIDLQSLECLELSGCSRLSFFPDISTNIEKLYLIGTAIEEVPCWIEKFSKLESLDMKGCNQLKSVSLNISKLEHLEDVDFSDCKALTRPSWSDSSSSVVSFFGRSDISISFTKEAPFQPKALCLTAIICLLLMLMLLFASWGVFGTPMISH